MALGGAMMEPDTRIATNEKGFCPRHFAQLYDAQNRLSLALMTHTHLKDVMASTDKQSDALLRALEAEKKKNPVARAASGVAKASPFHKQLAALVDSFGDPVEFSLRIQHANLSVQICKHFIVSICQFRQILRP